MPHHFETIKEQMRQDIVEVLSELGEPKVIFGTPLKPVRSYPHAIALSSVQRQGVGRRVEETYLFSIEIRLPLPDAQVIDRESYLYAWGDRLVKKLAPFSGDDVPAPAGEYAGVASLRRVGEVTPGDEKDTDAYCSVRISFSCMAIVFQ